MSRIASREELIAMNKKAVLSPRIGKHGKQWKTIAKEKMREHYVEVATRKFDLLANRDIDYALRLSNWKARAGVRDQLIGKAPEKIEPLQIIFDVRFFPIIQRLYGAGALQSGSDGQERRLPSGSAG